MASIQQQWTGIKKGFEAAAKRKRPSEKTLGVFNKPSGLTPATVALNKAIAAQKAPEIAKALAKVRTTATAYLGTIKKSLASEKDTAGQALLTTMSADVSQMIDDAQAAAKRALKVDRCASAADLLALMKDKPKAEQLMAFAKKGHADAEIEFVLMMAARRHDQKTYDTYLAEGAPKSVDMEDNVRDDFKSSMAAGNIAAAPWNEATAWILRTVNEEIIGKFNAESDRLLS